MDIERLEALLGIKVSEEQRPTYTARLQAAIAHINDQCGGRFSEPLDVLPPTYVVTLPPDVQLGAALLVDEIGKYKSGGVASKSLGDMSTSFFQGAGYKSASKYWRRYMKARFY